MGSTALISPFRYRRINSLPAITARRCHRRTLNPGAAVEEETTLSVPTEEHESADLSRGMSSIPDWSQADIYRTFVRFAISPELNEGLSGEYASIGRYPLPEVSPELFQQLKAIWEHDTAYLSDLTQICDHWAYQKIVAMGRPVLPLILRELDTNPDYWFCALQRITGENPVPSESQGRLVEMALAWLTWAGHNGISW